MLDHRRRTVFPAYRCKLQYTSIDALFPSEIRCREVRHVGLHIGTTRLDALSRVRLLLRFHVVFVDPFVNSLVIRIA